VPELAGGGIKKGRPSEEGRPRYRAHARWEESVPNPALLLASVNCLNLALMAWRRSVFLAIADPARLQNVIERKLVGDALSRDPKRPRSDHVDLALPEIRRPAAVVDDGRGPFGGEHRPRTIARPVLELRERQYVRETLPDRRLVSRRSADLPNAARDLGQCRGLRRRRNGGHGYRNTKNHRTPHGPHFSTRRLRLKNEMIVSRHFVCRPPVQAPSAPSRSSTSRRRSRPGSTRRRRPFPRARLRGSGQSPSGHNPDRSGSRG